MNRLVAAWWVLTGDAVVWPKAGDLEASLGCQRGKGKAYDYSRRSAWRTGQ